MRQHDYPVSAKGAFLRFGIGHFFFPSATYKFNDTRCGNTRTVHATAQCTNMHTTLAMAEYTDSSRTKRSHELRHQSPLHTKSNHRNGRMTQFVQVISMDAISLKKKVTIDDFVNGAQARTEWGGGGQHTKWIMSRSAIFKMADRSTINLYTSGGLVRHLRNRLLSLNYIKSKRKPVNEWKKKKSK